ncbi:leucine-rich repeat protein [Butyrivibrio sp. XPD2002]|uniref:leucine-rich repeat protein n=1 Tax=Butyrivibrio sp. XPD2002 TaxID=1280665 RepID=UPI00068881AA|nr:leucine-rich repeat protein [Butyrivibrio sp. XPD2002]
MRKNKKLWSYALAGALAVSNLSGVVAAPFTAIVAQAEGETTAGVNEMGTLSAANRVKNIPTRELFAKNDALSGNGKNGLTLTSTVTYTDSITETVLAPKATVSIKDETGKDATGFAIDDNTFSNDVDSSKKSSTVSGTIAVVTGQGTTAKAGSYVATVDLKDQNNKVIATQSYAFNVVGIGDDFAVTNPDGDSINAESKDYAELDVGDDATIILWNDGAPVEKNITWAAKAGDDEFITVSSNGKVTGKKQTNMTEAQTPAPVPAMAVGTWKMNADLSLAATQSFVVADDQEPIVPAEIALAVDGRSVVINEHKASAEMEEGATSVFSMTYGESNVNVAWESLDESVIEVGSNGSITALKAGTAGVKGSYSYVDANTKKTVNETITVNVTVTAIPEKEAAYFVGSKTKTTADIVQGESLKVTYTYTDGSKIPGTITWKVTGNEKVTVNNGNISVAADAKKDSTANIYALVDGESVGVPFVVTVKEKTAVEDKYALSADKPTLYFGQSATITRKKNGTASSEGTLELSGEHKAYFTLSGNTVKATKATTGEIKVNVIWKIDNEQVGEPAEITLNADKYEVTINSKGVDIQDGETAATKEITTAEVGETYQIVAAMGNTDLTSKMTWTSTKPDYVSVTGGLATALKVSKGVKVKGEYTENTVVYSVEVTFASIKENSGALEAAETALQNADEATTNAESASKAADEAVAAANKAKDDPTAENLKAADDALTQAQTDLKAAQDALEAANTALKEAKAAGAKSDEADAAVKAAERAVETAEGKVEAAEKAVAFAENTFEELAPEVEKIRLKEAAIAEAEAAADAALANPTDETIKKANDAVAAAKSKDATDAELKAATDKIAQAVEAKKTADEEAKKKADEEAKKKAEEEAKAADGSAKDTPAAAGTELVDANGNKTGFKVTDANASAPEVEYEGPSDKNATKADIPETYTDLSGNVYKVVGIDARAFKDTKVKTVTIRKNIKRIDPKAFEKSKVKNVKIKGTKLTKKMAKSFKKLKKGGKIKCSGSHKKKNKEILNNLSTVKNGKTKVK